MTVSPSVLQAQAASAAPGFTFGDAVWIFAVVVVVLVAILAFTARRTRQLAFRPRARTAHNRRIRRAAERDVESIERDAQRSGPDAPRSRDDEL